MSEINEIGNTPAVDLDALVNKLTAELIENATYTKKTVKRGRKGAGSNLAMALLDGKTVEYYEHRDKRVVEKLRELGFNAYTQWGAFTNSVEPTLKKNGILEPQFNKEIYTTEVLGITLEKVKVKLLKV